MKLNKNQVISIISIICIVLFGVLYNNLINKNKITISPNNSETKTKDVEPDKLELTASYNKDKEEIKEEVKEEEKIKEEIMVYITGEVKNTGVYTVKKDSRINDLVQLAGGLTENADVKKINLAKIVLDEEHIHIFAIGDTEIVTNNSISNPSQQKSDIININTADASELMNLPGIGEVTANNIIMYRNENGNFKTIEDIKNVKRIGDATFNNIKDLIRVN